MKALKTAVIVIGVAALTYVTAGGALALAGGGSFFAGAAFAASAAGGALGVSASVITGAALMGGVGLAMSLMPKPSMGGSQTKWKADPWAGLPYVMGRSLIAGNIVGKRGSGGKNTYEHFTTVLSVGPIDAIEASFANRTTLDFGADHTPVSDFYNGRLWQVSQLGACPEAAALAPAQGAFPGWTASSKLSGLAATLVSLKYDSKGKKTFTTEPQMAWIVRGVCYWDPRLDDTYPGGSGPCRALDESTYVYGEDPHLHALTWCLGRWQNGKRVIGIGAPLASIDVPSFVEGANLNTARGWKAGGQVVSRPDTPWNSLKAILQAGGATPVLVGGVISSINRTPRVSLATITAADIAGDCSFSGTQPRRSRINGVIPMYRSEQHDWAMVSAAGVFVADYVAQDGDERTREIQYPLVQDVDQATQLGTYEICDAREAGPGTVPLKPWWLNYRIGDCVTFAPEDGFSTKCIITGREVDAQSGVVTHTLRTETDSKHAFALGKTGAAPPTASIIYDPAVDAPSADAWTLTGFSLTSTGGSLPALQVDGIVDNTSASRVMFELRPHIAGQLDDDGWEGLGVEKPDVTRKVITSATPGTAYDVSIRYEVRGFTSDRLILGPATAGALDAGTATNAAMLGGTIDASYVAALKARLDASPY